MNLLILKLILTPIFIGTVTLAARRWGHSIGGLLIGLPLTSGPVSVFLALEQGQVFAARAASSTLLGLASTVAFCVAYALSSRRFNWAGSLSIGVGVYAAVTYVLSLVPFSLTGSIILILLFIVSGLVVTGLPKASNGLATAPWWDLPMRIVAATSMVLLITEGAQLLGPKWSGLLSPYPVFASVLAIFAHHQGDATGARNVLRGVIFGSFAFVSFFIVVGETLEHAPLIAVYLLATASAVAVNGLVMLTTLRRQRAA